MRKLLPRKLVQSTSVPLPADDKSLDLRAQVNELANSRQAVSKRRAHRKSQHASLLLTSYAAITRRIGSPREKGIVAAVRRRVVSFFYDDASMNLDGLAVRQ